MKATTLNLSAAQLASLTFLALTLVFPATPAMAQPGGVNVTPEVIPELPVEIETELGPAGSLKQAPLWKEIVQLLEDPYAIDCPVPAQPTKCTAEIERRPGFGATMPPLNVYPVDFNVLTGQPLLLRTSDGEISWDQPGPLFDPDEIVPVGAGNVPTALRTVIGELVVVFAPATGCPAPAGSAGCLAVRNPELGDTGAADQRIPPDGTIVAVPAFFDGLLHELDPTTGDLEEIVELETPINEIDFLRPADDTTGVPPERRPFVGRAGAEVLGKALFWDMQVGSDGVQACGSCHFHAGVDNRTKDQLNPGTLFGNLTLEVKQPGQDVVASDFPFHRLTNPDIPGEPNLNPGNVASDANDVMSSMGVSRFKKFVDIPPIGPGSFGPAVLGIRPLLPDVGTVVPGPVEVMEGRRRVEPRNTPTMHSAAFNFDNFWDGRARFHFNGGSVFGPSDPQFHAFIDPGGPGPRGGGLQGTTNRHVRPDLVGMMASQPIRIKFSSLASQAMGPPLSNFEMSFDGRNWAKIGKKLLQNGVTPLANQRVATDDSELGPFSNQGGANCPPRVVRRGKPGLCISYNELIELAFKREYRQNTGQRLNGAASVCTGTSAGFPTPAGCDPFDGYVLTVATGAAAPGDTNQFRQREANFSLFFGLAVQIWEQLLIPDDTPFDQFLDANPLAGNGVAQPGEQGTLPPETIRELVTGSPDGELNFKGVCP